MKVGGRLFWMTFSVQGLAEFATNFLRMDPDLRGPCLSRSLTMLHDDVLAVASPGPELVGAFHLPTHHYHKGKLCEAQWDACFRKLGSMIRSWRAFAPKPSNPVRLIALPPRLLDNVSPAAKLPRVWCSVLVVKTTRNMHTALFSK